MNCKFSLIPKPCVIREPSKDDCRACLKALAENDQAKLERICPVCHADRKEVHDSLHQAVGSENYDLAVAIIQNCESCTAEIAEAERRLQRSEMRVELQ